MMKKEKLVVAKIGGNIIDDKVALSNFLSAFAALPGHKILVHGGGKLASQLAEKLQVPVKIVSGRRITDADTLAIITMVYAGKINKNVVAELQGFDCNAIGLSGADGNIIEAIKRPKRDIDFGFVGDVEKVNIDVLKLLLKAKITPCFCAITHDKNGQLLNTNADTISAELAGALSSLFDVELFYCFEKSGVLQNVHEENSVIEQIDRNNYQLLKDEHIIVDGMLPKIDNSFYALSKGVRKVHIGKTEMIFNPETKHTTIQHED